jgi:hypothetical protein
MSLFVRATVFIAIGIVVLVLLGFLLKVLFIAVVLAALVAGGVFLYRWLRGRFGPAPIAPYRYRR